MSDMAAQCCQSLASAFDGVSAREHRRLRENGTNSTSRVERCCNGFAKIFDADTPNLNRPGDGDTWIEMSMGGNRRALRVLENIRAECDQLSGMEFPSGAAREMATIKAATYKLEVFIRDSKEIIQLPWARPLPEEQAEWEAKCPMGGALLRRQVCLAAAGHNPAEWFMGCLSISDNGILFEDEGSAFAATGQLGAIFEYGTGLGTGEQQAWNCLTTGLLKWTDIVKMQRVQGDSGPETVSVCLAKFPLSPLHVQLGIKDEIVWLEKAWKMCVEEQPPRTASQSELASRPSVLAAHAFADDVGAREQNGNPARSFGGRSSQAITQPRVTFFNAVAQLPAPERPSEEPLIAGVVENVDFEKFSEWFSKVEVDHWPVTRYMKEWLEAVEVKFLPWVPGRAHPGTLVRRGTCKIGLADIPWAVKMLVSFPPASDVTVLFSLLQTKREMIMVQQTLATGIPYSNCFKAQDMVVFKSTANGGLSIEKWHEIVWVSPVPAAFKAFLNKSSREITKINSPPFAKILEEEVRKNDLGWAASG